MKRILLLTMLIFTAFAVSAQNKTPSPTPPPPAVTPAPPPPGSEVLTPATKTIEVYQEEASLAKEKTIQLQAQIIQNSAEAQMAPLRTEFETEDASMNVEIEAIRKQNGWGPDVVLDRNPSSVTYGKWLRQPKPPEKPAKK